MPLSKVVATILVVILLQGCDRDHEESHSAAGDKTAERLVESGTKQKASPEDSLLSQADASTSELSLEGSSKTGGLLDIDRDCQPELATATAAANATWPTADNRSLSSDFPFLGHAGANPNCGLMPADLTNEDVQDSDKTSQCNRAILTRSWLQCINWSKPKLPEPLLSSGFSIKVIPEDLYGELTNAVDQKDWLGALSVMAQHRQERDDYSLPIGQTFSEYPDYSTITILAHESPQFTLVLVGDAKKFPELIAQKSDWAYFAYKQCDRKTDSSCPGPKVSPVGVPVISPINTRMQIVSVGNGCRPYPGSFFTRADKLGWASEFYTFNFCQKFVVPQFGNDYFNARDEDYIKRLSGNVALMEYVNQSKTEALEKVKFGELSFGDARSAVAARYLEYFDKVTKEVVALQSSFFSDLQHVRALRCISDDEDLRRTHLLLPPEINSYFNDSPKCSAGSMYDASSR